MTDHRLHPSRFTFLLLFLLSGVLLFSIPFGLALEVHHVFSEIDHDGHEHAEHDLCTWVQQHTGGSYVQDICRAGHSLELNNLPYHPQQECECSLSLHVDGSRAPPFS